MIILHRVALEHRLYHWYSVYVQPTFFDRWSVVYAWGSLRSNFQQQRAVPCESNEAAGQLAAQIVNRKEKRGYVRKENLNPLDSSDSPL